MFGYSAVISLEGGDHDGLFFNISVRNLFSKFIRYLATLIFKTRQYNFGNLRIRFENEFVPE